VAVPLDAALSASRRAVAIAVVLALGCALGLVAIEAFGVLPLSRIPASYSSLFEAVGIATATIYASALAFSAESLARMSRNLLTVEEERYRLLAHNISDVISRHSRNARSGSFRRRRKPCSEHRPRCCSSMDCSTGFMLPIARLI
jgi:cell cycle sensor histidine kinase DivJ